MQNNDLLKDAFSGLVGFFQYYNPEYIQLDDYLAASSSGLYAQTTHPLCTIENIVNSAPDFNNFIYPTFSENDVYEIGNIVVMGDDLFKKAESGWVKFKPFNTWLRDIYNAAVIGLLQDIVLAKRMNESTKQVIDSLKLFDGLGRLGDRVVNDNNFVGVEISLNRQEGLSVIIDQIGVQLDSTKNFSFYLFNANDFAMKKIIPCIFNRTGGFAWQKVKDAVLNYLDENESSNGVFWLGYYQKDLETTQAINRAMTWSYPPCVTCNEWNALSFSKWSRHVKVRAFSIPALSDRTLTGTPTYSDTVNYGINLSLTVSCDLTNLFIKYKNALASGLALKLSLKLLSEIAFTTRINVISDITKKLAMAELSLKDPDSFVNKYQNELKGLDFDFSNLSTDCLPCNQKRSTLSYSAI